MTGISGGSIAIIAEAQPGKIVHKLLMVLAGNLSGLSPFLAGSDCNGSAVAVAA
jgi:hypothetical protein